MFRLTRQVRFAIDDAPDATPSVAAPASANGFAGVPPPRGLDRFYSLDVSLIGELGDATGYITDIKAIDSAVRRLALPLVAAAVRQRQGPASLIGDLFQVLSTAWSPARLGALRLSISPFQHVRAIANEVPMVRFSQQFEFAASHRLHNPQLSDEQNRSLFGKCNNPHGHGHNYVLEVTLAGQPDESGRLIDVAELQQLVNRTIIDRFDHRYLNVELPEFRERIPSVENIAMVAFGMLKPALSRPRAHLAAVTVWETPKTWCEYSE